MLLSIIIPVYNSKDYLERTVKSVLVQNFDDYELILVDDGSTDGSSALCDSFQEQYSCIRTIHKSNGGVSSARNVGIEEAKGKYIMFVDSDDTLEQGMILDLLQEIEDKQADKIFCGLNEISFDGSHSFRLANLPERKRLDRTFIVSNLLYIGCLGNSYMNSVCGGVFLTDLIRKNNLYFENRPMGEDWLFNMKYCDLAQSVVYIDKPYYQYMRNTESAMSHYHPNQFDLWLENRSFRKEMSTRYHFNIDTSKIDRQWVTKVLFYAIQVIQNDSEYYKKLYLIFSNIEFEKALANTKTIDVKFFLPVFFVLKLGQFRIAIILIKFITFLLGVKYERR